MHDNTDGFSSTQSPLDGWEPQYRVDMEFVDTADTANNMTHGGNIRCEREENVTFMLSLIAAIFIVGRLELRSHPLL